MVIMYRYIFRKAARGFGRRERSSGFARASSDRANGAGASAQDLGDSLKPLGQPCPVADSPKADADRMGYGAAIDCKGIGGRDEHTTQPRLLDELAGAPWRWKRHPQVIGGAIRRHIRHIEYLPRHIEPLRGLATMPGNDAFGDLLLDQYGRDLPHQSGRGPRRRVDALA